MGVVEGGLVALRDRARLAEMTGIALRFGLGDILARLGLGHLFAGQKTQPEATTPERLRQALEELGPCFIKLGQILSTRSDMLGPDWIAELEKLQSGVPPEPWETVRAELVAALGEAPEEIFAHIETEALAAGSIAQVHRARLKSGEDVVVKVRRTGLRAKVEADLRLISALAQFAEKSWPDLSRYRPQEVIHQLGQALSEELDLASEGRNCETIAANLRAMDGIEVPRIFTAFSTERTLVQGFMAGLSPTDKAGLAAQGLDGRVLAQRGATAFLHMALVDGVFHADPHPGNLRALPQNRVGFIDFGMVGRLGGRRREQLLDLLMAIVEGQGSAVALLLLDWSGQAPARFSQLEAGCEAFVARHGTPPLRLADAVHDFMALARDHQLVLPSDLALLFKALITADGVMRQLDPDFDAITVAKPLVYAEMKQRYSPSALLGQGGILAREAVEVVRGLPAMVRLLTRHLRQGRLSAEVELKGLERIGGDIRWAATRLAVAIVTAAFALGLAPRLTAYGPMVLGVPAGTWAGLALIAAGLLWIIAPGRRT